MPDFGRWNANGGDPSLNEINRTDQFLDALASQQPVYSTDRGDAELAYLLAGWRDDVRETPMGSVLTTEEAAAALDRASSPGRRRRLSLAVVGSAAAAVLCLGGFGAVIAGSGPGDALYGLRTVLFGEQTQARDDAVALAAQTEMQQVQKLIEQGDWQGAQAKLEAVTTTVAGVGNDERKAELVSQWQELTVKVEAQDPAATVSPGAPLPTFPSISVDPNTLSLTVPTETTSTSSSTDPSATSPSSETSTSGSPAPSSETSTSVGASSPTPTPSSTTAAPSPTPTTTVTTAAPSPTPTTTVAPTPTSTSVVTQQSTTASATSAPRATPTPQPTPQPSPTPLPTSTLAPATTVPSPVQQVVPTTTTLLVIPAEPAAPVIPATPPGQVR
ncbi:hypothetical protein BST22_15315 [Mycolicibacterium chubuense]|uniref:Anti-sigma-D factor RsdA n=1 Tax=Mycolicibacterium chubuense TaxID=1800 RepID=A0A0J6W1M2_MYCCU|nr:anti-sigma-D factor RsdA [Mycolicibacterium chubuense]KMO77230.1 Anti-sigma-D factor RsdA [Mycolicibacterium chubuense]ORA50904.1 hypothetical protein BST22_15315 [Mycolicibacterium chubuense]SPY00197.1 Conserved protein of uncharacterised function, alanine and proline rich protein [Mycolicibacterium chubuense]